MTTMGTSATFTRLPGFSISVPVRPSMGERMVQYSRLSSVVLMAASSARTIASEESAALVRLSTCCAATTPSASERRLGLGQRRFVRTRINLQQDLSFADEIAFFEIHIQNLTRNLRLDRDGCIGFHIPHSIQLNRDSLLPHLADHRGNGRPGGWRRLLLRATSGKGSHCQEEKNRRFPPCRRSANQNA